MRKSPRYCREGQIGQSTTTASNTIRKARTFLKTLIMPQEPHLVAPQLIRLSIRSQLFNAGPAWGPSRRDPPAPRLAQPSDLRPNLTRGVQRHTIHPPRSDRARAMVRRYLSCGRRDEGKGRIRITRRGRIAGSRPDKRLAEKALHAKTKFKLTHRRQPSLRCGPCTPARAGTGVGSGRRRRSRKFFRPD